MCHECPECGEMCYCGNDMDDCLLNLDEDVEACTHCDPFDDDDDYDESNYEA